MEQYIEETKEERKRRIQAEKRRLKHLLRIVAVFVLILAVLVIMLLVQLVRSRLNTSSVGTTAGDEFSFTYVGEATQGSGGEGGEAGEEGGSTEVIALPVPEVSADSIYSDYARMIRASDGAVVVDKSGT